MIPISPTNSRISRLKDDFLTFAWAKPWVILVGVDSKYKNLYGIIIQTFRSPRSTLR